METELQNRYESKINETGGEITSKNFFLKLFTSEAVYEFLVHIIMLA